MRNYESYYNLPSWMLPVLTQRTIPHPVWITALGSPKLRDIVVANQDKYATEEFQFLFVASANVNWPYGADAALSYENGTVTVSKEFFNHTRDVANWTLDEPFQTRYPELRDHAPFTKYPEKDAGGHPFPD